MLPSNRCPSAPNLRPLPNKRLLPPITSPPQCEDTEAEIIVFKKGEIVDVPCHYEHKVGGWEALLCRVWADPDACRAQRGPSGPGATSSGVGLHSMASSCPLLCRSVTGKHTSHAPPAFHPLPPLQRHGKKWHWKPSQKRKTRGDVCECE